MQVISRQAPICASALVLALFMNAAHADAPPQEGQEATWSVGLGVGSETSPYRGVDTETRALPVLAFENARVRLMGPSLDVKLPSTGSVSWALRARYADQGYQASDAPELAGMAERQGGLWLGARADWRLPWGQLSGEWLGDAQDRSGGQQFKLEASHRVSVGGVGIKPHVALVWQDKSMVDYYYGVRQQESRAGRNAYAGKSTLNTEIGLQLNVPIAPGHSAMMGLTHTVFGSGIKNSPLVDRNGVSAVRAAYIYRF